MMARLDSSHSVRHCVRADDKEGFDMDPESEITALQLPDSELPCFTETGIQPMSGSYRCPCSMACDL